MYTPSFSSVGGWLDLPQAASPTASATAHTSVMKRRRRATRRALTAREVYSTSRDRWPAAPVAPLLQHGPQPSHRLRDLAAQPDRAAERLHQPVREQCRLRLERVLHLCGACGSWRERVDAEHPHAVEFA